jgi:hypothetical protein
MCRRVGSAITREIVLNNGGLPVAVAANGAYVLSALSGEIGLSSEDFKMAIRTELKNGK